MELLARLGLGANYFMVVVEIDDCSGDGNGATWMAAMQIR